MKGPKFDPPQIRHKIKTSERIAVTFGVVDYVREICPLSKFDDSWVSGGFLDEMYGLLTFSD